MKKSILGIIVLLVLCCTCVLAGCSDGYYDGDFGGGEDDSIVTDAVNRKLVYYVRISIKTASPEDSSKTIVESAKAAGGFVQNQEQNGDGTTVDSVYLTVRIPTEKLDDFVATLGNSGKIVSKRVDMTDITTQYVNASAEKASLQNRKHLLEEMLTTEGLSASDKISIISEISAVDTRLQALELQLNSFDSMVNYSTVSITLYKPDTGIIGAIFSVFVFFAFMGLVVTVIVLAVKFAEAKKKLKQ